MQTLSPALGSQCFTGSLVDVAPQHNQFFGRMPAHRLHIDLLVEEGEEIRGEVRKEWLGERESREEAKKKYAR